MTTKKTQLGMFEEGMLDELAKADNELEIANDTLEMAEAKFDVAQLKYCAIRDAVTRFYGHSPYIREGKLKGRVPVGDGFAWREFGKFRFINMALGDAIVDALIEVEEPMTLLEIIQRLHDGHVSTKPEKLRRAVNAALMRTKGIKKTEDGKYMMEDLPF